MINFSFCFNDIDGYAFEYDSLSECKKAAIEYSKKYPDFEILIYTLSSLYIKNGRIVNND